MTVPFLNKQHPNLIKIVFQDSLFLENKEEKAKEPQKLGLAMVEKGGNPCPVLFVLQGEFYDVYDGVATPRSLGL